MTNEEKNKKLAGYLGIPWHEWISVTDDYIKCSCGKIIETTYKPYKNQHLSLNPDFTHDHGKVELLRLMKVRPDWFDFLAYLRLRGLALTINPAASVGSYAHYLSEELFIDKTSKLRDAALEFFEGRKK